MSATEILVVVAGLFIGYWVVSKLFLRGPDAVPPGASPAWHEVLKVSPDATVEQIKRSYEVLRLAEGKAKEITNAYRDAMRARGLDP